jgi:hypothetical protein
METGFNNAQSRMGWISLQLHVQSAPWIMPGYGASNAPTAFEVVWSISYQDRKKAQITSLGSVPSKRHPRPFVINH